MNVTDQLLEAVSLAARSHAGQFRKDNKTPYASHPFRVCLVVRHIFGFSDERMLLTAILHDVLEDTTTDFDDLEDKFGAEIARWVSLLSKDKRLPDEERERVYCQALASAPWQVQVCKLGDVYDNLSDMANLPAERRHKVVERSQTYLATLEKSASAEVQKALALVRQLLA